MPVSQIYTEPGMEDLAGWYGQIRTLLDRAQIKPEALTDIAVTPKWLSVRGDGIQCGLAFRFGGEHAVYGSQDFRPLLERCKPWRGRALTAVIEALLAQSGLCERILCLAALNALSAPLNRPEALSSRGWKPQPPACLPFLQPSDRVVCVGYGALVDEVLAVCPQVHISDMRPQALLETYFLASPTPGPERVCFHPAGENRLLLSSADVVLLTGCTLANGTWRQLLEWSSGARVRGFFGPSAGLPPELLQTAGANYVTTTHITHPANTFAQLRSPLSSPMNQDYRMSYSLLL
ncbi:Rossmann-like domain-containing protein [Anaerotruncus colihominis]|uniref:Rossmann-like domain-containing protein n=1 Tax=Anaerotruncus colihominis TaxID=169435 RepID=UPI0026724BCA|nr:DUF364 domain-containing protein [Anaerotruncus colihominis]